MPSVPIAIVLDGGIGYVSLQRFNDVASEELGRAVTRLLNQGARGLVLDLRGNPGGDVEQSVRVTNLFLPPGQDVVTVKYRSRPADERRTVAVPVAPDIPLVVLTDSNTASAAEIVAGALQDHDRAVLLGTTSYGKGVVQTLYPLDGGWMLKLTNAKWYTPSGRSIQREHRRRTTRCRPPTPRAPPSARTMAASCWAAAASCPTWWSARTRSRSVEQAVQHALSAKARESNTTLAQMTKELKPKVHYNFTVQPAWRDTLYQRLTRSGVEDHAGAVRLEPRAHRPADRAAPEPGPPSATRRRSGAGHRRIPSCTSAVELLGGAHSQQDLLAVVVKEEG